MNTNKILLAGFVGGVVLFILGGLTFGLALASFFESNAGSATGVARDPADILWIPMILGHLAGGLLFAVIFGRWASITTFATGVKAGAILGFLIGCMNNLIQLGSTNLMNVTATIVNIVAEIVIIAIVGGIIALILGRGGNK